ncbi:MAG: SMC-Scp complex subunit ScpB [Anaerotruncus sp.]|jgi:segregation and condensation protein B|nr:SMC-Scp complex subunit ScpB [Anaerotruncus sp.]
MIEQQKQLLAILFAGGEAVEISRIAQALELEPGAVLRHAGQLRERLEEQGFPFELLQVGDRLQLATRSEYAQVVRDALELRRNAPLSQAAFEVLAIIAYNQPVTRAFIEQVRGVDSAGVVNSLLEKQLVEEAGRMELPGRPLAYQTTANFLRCFGLESIEALPELPDT